MLAILFVTRGHHVFPSISLPDATLALFFIAGVFLYKEWYYVLGLMLASGLTDYAAFQSGVSTACVINTNGSFNIAYLFLVPTYMVMWSGGYWFSKKIQPSANSLLTLGSILLGSNLLALIISSGSYYRFSDNFYKMGLLDYVSGVVSNYPYFVLGYFSFTFMYVSSAALITLFFKQFRLTEQQIVKG